MNNGEGSSSPRRSIGSGPNTGAVSRAGKTASGSPLAAESIHEHDFARRKQRVRRSGGFLLDAKFPSGLQPRPERHHTHVKDDKGKHNSRHDGARPKSSLLSGDASLLPEVQTDGQSAPNGERRVNVADSRGQDNDQLRVERTRKSALLQPPASQQQIIDPSQLVHMALNLSESRKRNVSANQLLAQSRVTSGSHREGSFSNQGPGSSLRHYLNEQRRISRTISPAGGQHSPSRHMSSSVQRSGSLAYPSGQSHAPPSAATLARADKFRAYIELRVEYWRLLEYLPPLKPNTNAPGNFVVSSNNVPGSPQAQLTRIPSHAGKVYDLGRPYNPLQYIRNRRSRARDRKTLDHDAKDFSDIEQVREWIDRIEQDSMRPGYRRDDGVQLPKLHAKHPVNDAPDKPPRPHKGWVFTIEELFADAHWLEQGDNKTLVENRHGRKIFPPKEMLKDDFLQPRSSKDYSEKRRRSWIDGLPTVAITGDESDKGSERGRKRRLLQPTRGDSPSGGKHSRRGSRLRKKDDKDGTDSETDNGKRKPRLALDTEDNIGPLALLLEQQTKNEQQTKSPAIISPDTPDKWGRNDVDIPENNAPQDSLDVPRPGNGFAYVKDHGNFKVPPRTRMNANASIDDTEPRSSFEDWESTAPNTPLHIKRFPHIGDDFSPPQSRATSKTRRSKRSKLNIFHSQEHGEDKYEIRPESAGTDKQRDSRQPSEEAQEDKHFGTSILAAPGAVRSLLSHRKNDSVSSLPSPDKIRRREGQEAPSAVSRFFKGVKQEKSKVGDFIFRRDRLDDSDEETVSDRNSVEFDTDASTKVRRSKRPELSRTVTAESTTSKKQGRSRLELPTFRPVNHIQLDEEDGSELEHHITRQDRERKNDRSPRFNRLAPPRMDLGGLSGNESSTSLSPVRSHSQDRINRALARPGVIGLPELPPTALRNVSRSEKRRRSSSRPTLDGKRHWSIADDKENVLQRKPTNIVAQADIARVRALFLCSGVKAKELARRAHSKRDPPPNFLTRAAATANIELFPVSRKEEHVLASRILVKDLESSTKALKLSLETFRNNAIKELTTQVAHLQSRVDADLMPRILDEGDKAVRITSEISGQGPLQVKEIMDEIDRMLRARRRRMRWLRGFGWMLVEWALLAVMWFVWLMVVLVGSVKKVLGIGWGLTRWLLWL